MDHLELVAAEVQLRGSKDVDWPAFANDFFPGENRLERIEEWARAHGLIACFDYKEQGFSHAIVRGLRFVRAGAVP